LSILVEVSIVPIDYVDHFWPQVEPLLKPAVDHSHGYYLVEDVYNYVINGYEILWVAHIAGTVIGMATTHELDYPQKTVLCISFWGGQEPLEDWGLALLQLIQRYARETGYKGIEAYGRSGWSKRLKNYGYEKIADMFEIPLQ
jgi:hypothetical protein